MTINFETLVLFVTLYALGAVVMDDYWRLAGRHVLQELTSAARLLGIKDGFEGFLHLFFVIFWPAIALMWLVMKLRPRHD